MSTLWLIDKASPYDICSDQQNYLHNANIMTLYLTEQVYKTDVRQKTENEILKWDKYELLFDKASKTKCYLCNWHPLFKLLLHNVLEKLLPFTVKLC